MVEMQTRISAHPEQTKRKDCDERTVALAISPTFEHVHESVICFANEIFASDSDRRVTVSATVFFAHFLRLARIVQLTLPNLGTCDVAVIHIPTVYELCTNKSLYAWPMCYEATLKYLRLLVAAGVFNKPKQKRGEGVVYHFPLIPYIAPNEHAQQHLLKIAQKKTKVSRSKAFQRISQFCTQQEGVVPASTIADSSMTTPTMAADTLRDETQEIILAEVQQSAHTIYDLVQRQETHALLPTFMNELQRLLTEHSIRVLHKYANKQKSKLKAASSQEGRFFAQAQTQSILSPEPSLPSQAPKQTQLAQTADSIVKNRPSHVETKPMQEQESIIVSSDSKNLLSAPKKADSNASPENALNEFNINNSNNLNNTDSFIENGVNNKNARQESAKSAQQDKKIASSQTTTTTTPLPLSWIFNNRLDVEEQEAQGDVPLREYLGRFLSYYFNHDDSVFRLRIQQLSEDARAFDLAVVDALYRSAFPDHGHRVQQLRGGWVTARYNDYHAGKKANAAITAWAETGYSYNMLTTLFRTLGEWQDSKTGNHGWKKQQRTRIMPHEVIINSTTLTDFWVNGAAQHLEEQGYLYVELDGALWECQDYQEYRIYLLKFMLRSYCYDTSPQAEYEIATYLAWLSPSLCDRETEAALLAGPRDEWVVSIETWLQGFLDPALFTTNVYIAPCTLRQGLMVSSTSDECDSWCLYDEKSLNDFLDYYDTVYAKEEVQDGYLNAQSS